MKTENWHRRHALGLASQLSDDASDTNAVIRELQHLVDTWLHVAESGPTAAAPSKVLTIVRELP
jgi:hypothetical protein